MIQQSFVWRDCGLNVDCLRINPLGEIYVEGRFGLIDPKTYKRICIHQMYWRVPITIGGNESIRSIAPRHGFYVWNNCYLFYKRDAELRFSIPGRELERETYAKDVATQFQQWALKRMEFDFGFSEI